MPAKRERVSERPKVPANTTLREGILALATQEGREKGTAFEHWLVATLPQIPSTEIARAWRWQNSPLPLRRKAFGRSLAERPDTGVDILAERHDGGLIAIQAKCLHPDRKLVLDDLKQFWLKTKGNDKLAANWVVTTGEWGGNVAAHASDANGALINAQTEWGDLLAADLGRVRPLELDDNQKTAWQACIRGLRNEDRGQLVMACGTGKTLVSLRVAEKVAPPGGLVVYATPSIALTGQSRRSWLQNAKRPMRTMVVCSDEDEGAGGSTSSFTGFISEIEAPVTTDPRTIATKIRELSGSLDGVRDGLVAVFATYQSLHRICTAQEKHGLADVDFVVADEAHRTAGKYDRDAPGPFQVVHHRLRAAKRLYQTATPRIYSKRSSLKISKMVKSALESGANIAIQDMNDQSIYGRQFHRLSFREALQASNPRLCDYRVIVLGTPLSTDADAIAEDGGVRETDDVQNTSRNMRVAALAQAMQYGKGDMEEIRSCIAFCNRVAFAGAASRLLGDERLSKWGHARALQLGKVARGTKPAAVNAGSLSARDNAKRRGDELQRLRTANKHVTTNVNVLSEGIDVPALDAICFLDERKSEVEIVQAVGRVMRRPADGSKNYGYIVVPVVMSPQATLEESLSTGGGDWSVVGQVLRALKAHDDRIETDLTDILRIHAPSAAPEASGSRPEALDFWQKLAKGEFDALAPVLAESGILGDQRAQTANLIKAAVVAAAHALAEETGMGRTLAPVVGVADVKEDAELRACTQAALILMNACLVHERLVQTGNAIDLPKLGELTSAGNVSRKLAKAWRKILAHDYKPIFQPAVQVLKAADMGQKQTPKGMEYALYGLAQHAEEVAEKYAAAGMDHAGELFQAAMDNPQADGAYYTLTPGAMLLAELACDLYAPPDDPLWRKPSTWKKIAMMDPACGSGTLLVAFAAAVRRRAAEQGAKPKQLEKIHRAFVEQGMVGLDINRRAVQIAAAQLTMGGLGADFRNMGLWTLPRGRRGGWRDKQSKAQVDDVMLGSLELLFDNEDGGEASDFEKGMAESAKSNRDRHRRGVEVADLAENSAMMQGLGKVAIALTNPPFSSLKTLAADLEADVRTALGERMASLRENVGARWSERKDAMSADSIRPPFSFILAERVDQENGAVGKVVPTRVCTNSAPAGIAERRLLAEQFEVVAVISLHDPKAYAWSVKGHQESLLLMRRTPPGRRSETVAFVSVLRRPTNAEEAMALYEGLREGDLGDLGRICEWPRERVEAGDWSPAVFYEPALAEACHELDQLPTKGARFVRLGDLYEVNTTKQTVGQSKWTWCEEDEAEVPVAKSASESGQTRLQGRVDGWAKRVPAKRDNKRELDLLTAKAGRLLVPNTQDASSGRLSAIAFDSLVVGYAWTPVQNVSATDAQALAVWINSTVGRILLRKYSSRRANWPMYQPAAIKQLVVPNTAGRLWKHMQQPLLEAYRATKDKSVPQYREPAAEVRRIWDGAVAKAAGIPARKINYWRELMDAEPFVASRRIGFP